MSTVTVGIDVGGSTTKIVGFRTGGELITPCLRPAADPVTSAYGALGKFTAENRLSLSDLRKIMVTGVGSSFLGGEIYGCPCEKSDEFSGRRQRRTLPFRTFQGDRCQHGYRHGAGLCRRRRRRQLPLPRRNGRSGGTVVGLSKQMLGIENMEHLVELAEKGDLSRIDLRISDITPSRREAGPPRQHDRLQLR